jgi:pimeloyl-ACP methyl ester carboxylesterase
MIRGWRLFCLVSLIALQFVGLLHAQEAVSLVTRDGVQLRITYFAGAARKGSPQAKQTTPVVLLHDHKSSRAVFASLAQKLRAPVQGQADRPSLAAVTVDLRAHGESTKQSLGNSPAVDLDAAKLSKDEIAAMARIDMEAVRNFLVDKNDAGELNLNKLCLVGSGMGASVAANWALADWAAPPLAVGKQGQDVKAIVLVSPRWSYNGLSMHAPMQFRALKENVAWLLIYGEKDSKFQTDAGRVRKQLERFHPATEQAGGQVTSGLTVLNLPTRLEGDSLLKQFGTSVETEIVKFVIDNVARKEQPWISRRNRLP